MTDSDFHEDKNIETFVESMEYGENREDDQNLDNEKTLNSNEVEYKYSKKGELKKHGPVYQCNQCEYQTKGKNTLKRHIDAEHGGIKYPCQYCQYEAKAKEHLKKHVEAKHEGIKYPCSQCDLKSSQMSNLRTHMKRKHGLVLWQKTSNVKEQLENKYKDENYNIKDFLQEVEEVLSDSMDMTVLIIEKEPSTQTQSIIRKKGAKSFFAQNVDQALSRKAN